MKDWHKVKTGLLKNSDVSREYKNLEPEYKLAQSLLKARLAKKMTQAELAERAGIKQAMIARLESGTTNPTIVTVAKVSRVLGKELKLVGSTR
jgi:ribosome-binding protein aMBF1 (putative translation factor)